MLEELNKSQVIGIGHSMKSTKVRVIIDRTSVMQAIVQPIGDTFKGVTYHLWVILGVHSVKRHLRKCLQDTKTGGPILIFNKQIIIVSQPLTNICTLLTSSLLLYRTSRPLTNNEANTSI